MGYPNKLGVALNLIQMVIFSILLDFQVILEFLQDLIKRLALLPQTLSLRLLTFILLVILKPIDVRSDLILIFTSSFFMLRQSNWELVLHPHFR